MIVTPASPGRTSPPHRAPWAGSPKPSTFTSIAHFHLAAEIQYWVQQSNYQTDQPSLGCRTSWFRPAPWQRPEQMLVGTSIQTLLVSPEHLSGPPSPRRQNQEASGQPRHREPDQCDWKCLRCQTFECFRWRFFFLIRVSSIDIVLHFPISKSLCPMPDYQFKHPNITQHATESGNQRLSSSFKNTNKFSFNCGQDL